MSKRAASDAAYSESEGASLTPVVKQCATWSRAICNACCRVCHVRSLTSFSLGISTALSVATTWSRHSLKSLRTVSPPRKSADLDVEDARTRARTMAGNATSLTHLELIGLRSTPSEQEVYILNALNLAIHPATWETAKEAARLLDATCPPLDQHEEILNYLWMIWDIMTDIARSPDVESAVQESLIRVLESLRFFSRGDLTFWGVGPH